MDWLENELRKRRQRTIQRAPQKGGSWDPKTVLPIVGLGIILAGIVLKIMAYTAQLDLLAKFMLLMSNLVLLLGILFIPFIIFFFINVYQRSNKGELSCLFGKSFKDLLIQTGLYTISASDLLRVELPSVRLCQAGFELSAIGGLKAKLLSDETIGNFNAFLSLNNSKRVVESSYYQDGWVHYVVRRNSLSDRLKF